MSQQSHSHTVRESHKCSDKNFIIFQFICEDFQIAVSRHCQSHNVTINPERWRGGSCDPRGDIKEGQAGLSSVSSSEDDQDSPGLFPRLLPRLRQPRPCRGHRGRGDGRQGPGGGPLHRPDQGHDHQPDQRHPRDHHHHHSLHWPGRRRPPLSTRQIEFRNISTF